MRTAAARHLEGEMSITGHMVEKVIDEHGSLLLGMDRRWRLAQHFLLHMIDGGAQAQFKRAVLGCLPGAGRAVTVHASVTGLAKLATDPLYDFVDTGCRPPTTGCLTMRRPSQETGRSAPTR